MAVFARVELRRVVAPSPAAWRAGVAALLVAAGMAVLARKGFVQSVMPLGLPVVGVVLVAGGWSAMGRSRPARKAGRAGTHGGGDP